VKAVLQLMTLNFADAGKRVVLGLCLIAIGICFVMQQSVLADNLGARRGLFTAQIMLLLPLMVPWALLYPRAALGRGWTLMPWARVKFVWSVALTTLLGAAVCAVLYAIGVAHSGGGIRGVLGACLTAFVSTFTLISLLTLPSLTSPARVSLQGLIFGLTNFSYVFVLIYSMTRGMPQIVDESWRFAVWMAFVGSVAAWTLGGWWFANHTAPAHTRRLGSRLMDFFERRNASHLMRQGAVATLLKAHWNAAFRAPTLGLLVLCCFVPLLLQPRGTDGFVAAMALFSVMTSIRALVLGQATAHRSRTLWLVRGDRDALLRECEAVLFRNIVTIACVAGVMLLASAMALRQSPSVLQLFIGFGVATFLPLLFACIGLLQMALPARDQWWAGSGGIAVSALLFFSPPIYAIASAEQDATQPLAWLTLVALLLFLVARPLARRLWRNFDWTFLPTRPQRWLQSR